MVSQPTASKRTHSDTSRKGEIRAYIMPSVAFTFVTLVTGILVNGYVSPSEYGAKTLRDNIPEQAQIIDQKSFNVLPSVPPLTEANATTVGIPQTPTIELTRGS